MCAAMCGYPNPSESIRIYSNPSMGLPESMRGVDPNEAWFSGEERNRGEIHRAAPPAELSGRTAVELCAIGAPAIMGDNVTRLYIG